MSVAVELVVDAHASLGEGPLWNVRDGTLDWVDISGHRLHRFDPRTGQDQAIDVGQDIGAFAHRRDGGFLLALRDGFALLDPGSDAWRLLAPVEADIPTNRMNDGKCDRLGRFWAGTLSDDPFHETGSLYRLDPDGSVTTILSGLGVANGLDWSPDERTMYIIDSLERGVDAWDFDLAAGTIANRHRVVDVEWDETSPASLSIADGMTVDRDGNLWIAAYGKAEVRCHAPSGALLASIPVPATGVTSCAFGGDDLGDLYITSAADLLTGRDPMPAGGGLFRCRPGVIGRPPNVFPR